MWNRKVAFWYGMVLIFISCFSISEGSDDYDDDQRLETFSRCPWIRNKLTNGRVRIRSRGRIAKFSCKAGYDLVGKRFATCVRGQWNSPIPICVTKGCKKQSAPKNGKIKELNQGATLSFECNPGYSIFGAPDIYCDGNQWDKEPPKCQATTLEPATVCDFEDPDLCGWTHDPTHDFDWKRNQFGTPSGHVGTGPSYDHTYGKGKAGFYMYGEASAPRNENDTSRLFSPVYSRNYSPRCFVFWYHMYGATIGALRIYLKKESSVLAELSPLWEKHGDQGNQWFQGNVTISAVTENFQVVIEGIRGHSYVGDTAIDDVSLLNASCSSLDSNSTEDVEVASEDSCRGRCHEVENSSSCGCIDACESDNTCCSDYEKLCAEKSETSNGEDEHPQSTAQLETEVVPELTVTDKIGTPLTVTAGKLYTESEASTEFSSNVTQEATQRPTVTDNIPRVTIALSSTGVAQTTDKPTTVQTTEELTSKTTLAATTMAPKNASVNAKTTGPATVTSQTTANPTSEVPTTIPKVSNASSVGLTTAMKTSTAATTTTILTTAVTTKGPPTVIQTSAKSSPEAVTVTDSKLSNRTSTVSPTTAAMMTSRADSSSRPTTEFARNSSSTEIKVIPLVTTSTAAVSSPTTLQRTSEVRTPEIVKTTPTTTKSVTSSPQKTTHTTVTDTQTPVRHRNISIILTTIPTTSKIETTSPIIKILPVIPTRTTISKTVRPPPSPITHKPIATTKAIPTTTRAIPTTTKAIPSTTKAVPTTTARVVPTTRFPGFVSTRKYIRTVKTSPIQTSTTESQPVKLSTEVSGPHASKAKADAPKNHSVIGICLGVIAVAGLIGAVAYFYVRRRNPQSKLRDDSEMRYLRESEVIEYADASVPNHSVLS